MFASLTLKKWIAHRWKFYTKYYRLCYSVFAVISLVIILWCQFFVESFLLFKNPWLRFGIGLPLALLGSVLMAICCGHYLLHLLGLEVFVEKDAVPVLKTNGLHSYVRHPLYLGTFIFLTGLFCCFPLLSNLIAATIIIAYTLIGIRLEEKKLLLEFGKAYSAYQKKVPMLIPFV